MRCALRQSYGDPSWTSAENEAYGGEKHELGEIEDVGRDRQDTVKLEFVQCFDTHLPSAESEVQERSLWALSARVRDDT
jgi:hypothetical protein